MSTEKEIRVSHFAAWNVVPDCLIENFMAELAAAGAEYITLMSRQLARMLNEPDYAAELQSVLKKLGLRMRDAHGLAGPLYDLDIPERHEELIEEHRRALGFCAEFGIRTYTVHVGAAPWCRRPDPRDLEELRSNALDTLEHLLPEAEKLGIILAVENSFEPVNTPEEVLFYIRRFESPFLRCCYDTGHANIMDAHRKDPAKYKETFHHIVWRDNLVLEEDALGKLAPYVVTCHLHDNCGYTDDHVLPGTERGTIDWKRLMERLRACPNLESFQNESNFAVQHVTAGEVCRIFENITGKL